MTARWIRLERMLDASPPRVYRAWSDPETLTTWFAPEVEGSLQPGSRSVLVWPDRRVWVDMLEAEPDRHVRFRWAWLEGQTLLTDVVIDLEPRGYGTRLLLQDGPFEMEVPEELDAFVEALEGWVEMLANLRASLDFFVDLRHVRGHSGAGPR